MSFGSLPSGYALEVLETAFLRHTTVAGCQTCPCRPLLSFLYERTQQFDYHSLHLAERFDIRMPFGKFGYDHLHPLDIERGAALPERLHLLHDVKIKLA